MNSFERTKENVDFSLILFSWTWNCNTVKPVYSGHLRFLKKVSAINQVSAIWRFLGNFRGSKFREICVFWTILRPSSRKNYCETVNSGNS